VQIKPPRPWRGDPTPEFRSPFPKVIPVEPAGLHTDHAENIVPLPIGHLAALAKPRQLGKDRILRAGNWKPMFSRPVMVVVV